MFSSSYRGFLGNWIVLKETVNGFKYFLLTLLRLKGVLNIEEIKTFISKLLVVLLDELGLHKMAAVGELGSKPFTFGLYNNHLVDATFGIATEDKKVGYILTNAHPMPTTLFEAVNLEVGQLVVAIVIYLQLLIVDASKSLLQILSFQLTIEAIWNVMECVMPFRVFIFPLKRWGDWKAC